MCMNTKEHNQKSLCSRQQSFRFAKVAGLACAFLVTGVPSVVAGLPKTDTPPSVAQQQKTVKGRILDSNGEPLVGASVTEKGTENRTVTDVNGDYTLQVTGNKPLLVFSYIGFTDQEIPLGNRSTVNLTMQEDNQTLNEVVVQGFGIQQKKESLTGAISSINAKDVSRSLSTTVSGALVGKIAGINSRQTDGRPGASTSIQIRNMGTPLYVIDGVVKDEGQFNNLDQNDIEQVSILKDASAAIYGVRAANGVVVVTTKHGHTNQDLSVEVNGYYGWQSLSRMAKPAN